MAEAVYFENPRALAETLADGIRRLGFEVAITEHDCGPVKASKLDRILTLVCDEFGLNSETLLADRRTMGIVLPRQIAMHLAAKHTKAGYPLIARFFGRKDHTTAMYADTKVAMLISQDVELAKRVAKLERALAEAA
jgi:chromosomal replication initiator protein